jgi:glycolate oxidase FAD binding subunit
MTPSARRTINRAEAPITRLAEKFGSANVLLGDTDLAGYEVDGIRPAAALLANSAEEISELLRFAAAEKLAVIPCGGRTKLGIGMPPARYDIALDLSRMNKVLAYEPRDLTLGVQPGIRFSTLAATLAAEKQFLPLNPPFLNGATIGGILATDSASPLRHAYGAPRDFVLGLEFVTGDGAVAKSGGRVVKNVSGYDLHKLLIGSLGTLAVITRANFKTFPMPQAQAVFVAAFESAGAAMDFCRVFMRSPLGAMQMDVISPKAGKLLNLDAQSLPGLTAQRWCVVISTAGNERVVERHRREIPALAAQGKAVELIALGDTTESMRVAAALLGNVREFPSIVMAADAKAAIFRIASLPSAMATIAQRLAGVATEHSTPAATILRPYGLIYFALLPTSASLVDSVRFARTAESVFRVADELGAKARIEFAPPELKGAANIWGAARPDFELMGRVKNVFDADKVLSPGRFAGGI